VDELSGFYMAQTLNLPLSISLVDRKAELRTNQSLISELFQEASVLLKALNLVGTNRKLIIT
jgi:hypothetical protein